MSEVSEVSEGEAQLVRVHRQAGRVAIELLRVPFSVGLADQLRDLADRAEKCVALAEELGRSGVDVPARVVELLNVAVQGRPGSDAL